MFALPALLQQSSLAPAGLDLLMTFASGVVVDAITPARVITVDAVTPVVRSTQRSGSTQGATSLVFNGLGSTGLVITDMTNVLNGVGSPTEGDFTVEFWAQLGDYSQHGLKITATGADVLSFGMVGNALTLQETAFTTATLNSALVNKRNWVHVAIVRRKVTGVFYGDLYYDGTLVETKTLAGVARTPLSINMFVVGSGTAIEPESGLNFFALTRGIKYSATFNPLTDTGLNGYFVPLSTGYCIAPAMPPPTLPALTPHLLLTFNNGTAVDAITPARVITLGANTFVRSVTGAGSYRAHTSLVANRNTSTGLVITDVSGLFLANTDDFTIEFWAAQHIDGAPLAIKFTAAGSFNIFSHQMNGRGGTVQGAAFNNTIYDEWGVPSLRGWVHYAYQRRLVFGLRYADLYINGKLRQTTVVTDVIRTLTNITLFDTGLTTIREEVALNYLAFTRGIKYNQTFNPDTDTNLNSYFLTPSTGYCT
jgi:hypothetical protein